MKTRVTRREEVFGPKRADVVVEVKEEPDSAKANYQLWKLAQDLKPEEIQMLITKRRNDLKYESNSKEINRLRTDISILEDAHEIISRKRKEEIRD